MTDDVVTTILTQFHVSKGIQVYGQPGVEAALTELKQIHDRMVIDLKDSEQVDSGGKTRNTAIPDVSKKETQR